MEKIIIDKENFKNLTSGKVIKYGDVEIILQDIGYATMLNIIAHNYRKSNNNNVCNCEKCKK